MPTVRPAARKPTCVQAIACAVLSVTCSVLSISCRSDLFYKTRHYDAKTLDVIRATPRIVEIEYRTSAGRQVSFYRAPEREPTKPPARLWLLFGGIDTLAFGWYKWMKDIPDKECGLLFIEYPGTACARESGGRKRSSSPAGRPLWADR